VITIDEMVVGDDAAGWHAAGFTVDDDDVVRAGSVRIRLAGRGAGEGVRSWSLRDCTVPGDGTIAGLVTALSSAPPCAPATHANGVTHIDHVVLATPDYARTIAALGAVGFELRRERDSGSSAAPMRQGFFRAGEVIIEVVGSPEHAGDGPARFFGLALTVDDLDACAVLLGDALGQVKDAVQPGRRIATLRHRDLGISTSIAFMSATKPVR
jgi:hypothetical protein